MIRYSIIVLFLGLQYYERSLDSGAQTYRLGWAGPVSYLHGDAALTGCFFCRYSVFLYSVFG
jgi:hypothetical protein